MSMSSSLQRAVATNNQATIPTTKGAFEACFSQGLDLSEFGSNTTSAPQVSASAELLKVKQQESEQRKQQDAEDAAMAQIVQQRTATLTKALAPPSAENATQAMLAADGRHSSQRDRSQFLSNFVVQLHNDDDRSSKASRRSLSAKNGGKNKAVGSTTKYNNKNNNNNNHTGGKKKMTVKKNKKRSKY